MFTWYSFFRWKNWSWFWKTSCQVNFFKSWFVRWIFYLIFRVYGGFYKHPRITEGSFRETITHLYECVHKKKLEFSLTGKPTNLTYSYAKNILNKYSEKFNVKLDKIYMIGDNLESDVKGANGQGDDWFSILVKTGVCKENSDEIKAKLICKDVNDAVKTIFLKHELQF